MKNWAKPEVKNLGFENTYEDIETAASKPNIHFCHSINDWHSTEGCTHNHGGGACKDPAHQWSEAHKSSCCCVGTNPTDPVPGLS